MSDVDIIINVATQGAKSITDLSASLRSLNKGLVDLNIPLKKLDAHSQAVAKALGIGARSANDHAKSLKGLITNQKALGAETRRIRTEIGAYRAAIGFAGTSNKAFADSARKSVAELKQMDRALRGMRIRAFGSDLQATSTRIQKIGKDAQFVGRSLMINLTAPIALFARTGFQQLVAVDKELVRLTKVLDNVALSAEQANRKLGGGASPKQVQGLINAFNDLNNELTKISSNYGVSKQLVVGLASDFAELGVNGHESILALTELTAQIEKLGAMDISGAQDLTQALYFQSVRAYENTGAFKGMTSAIEREALAVKAATTQMYLFNAIENVTALTLKDLGQAFPEVASMAVSFGLSMTEAAALLAPMKAAGLDVGASANSIKVSLQRALSPTTKNIKILQGLAESFGEAGDASSAFATANKTGLTGLQSITEIFDKVMASEAGMEGAMKLMSNLFEKRQGPRMFLAIEQLSLFNRELNAATRGANTAEGLLAGVAESALREFNTLNKTALPETVNNFKDIGIIARIATAQSGQMVEGFGKVNAAQIKTAKEARKAVADRILLEKQTKGRDVVSEVRTETGRAMIVELAGASNAAEVANAELAESLKSLSVVTERLKNNFKLFAADIMKAVVPMLQNLSEKVQELMNRWNNASQEFRDRVAKVVTTVAAFLAALGPIVLAIGTMQAVTGVLGRALAVFIPKLATSTGAFVGLGNAIRGTNFELEAHNILLNKQFKGPVLAKYFNKAFKGSSAVDTGADAIAELTARQTSLFGPKYKPPDPNAGFVPLSQRKKIIEDAETRAFRRSTGRTAGRMSASDKALLAQVRDIATKRREGIPLEPAEVGFFRRNIGKIRAVEAGRVAGETNVASAIARRAGTREAIIGRRGADYTKAGVMTDVTGSKFFSRRGREISEARANQLATGRFAAPVTDPLRRFGQKITDPLRSFARDPRAALAAAPRAIGRSIGRTVTRAPAAALSARAAISAGGVKLADKATDILGTPGKVLTKATDNAREAITKLNAQYALFGQGAPGAMAKAKTAMMAFGKSIKSVTVMMKVMKLMFLTTGIGAVLAVIGIAIYAVMKNMDSFKKGAKPLLDALSTAFGQIKQAIILTIQPIMDLFGAFGSGGTEGEAAANGIGAALAKLAGVVEFVSKVIQNLLLNVVKPVFSAIANIVMAVVSMFKGNWGDAFNYLLAALGYVGKAFINLWKITGQAVISIIAGIVKGGIKLFFNLVNGLSQMIIGALKKIVGGAQGLLSKVGLGGLLDGVMGSLDSLGGKVSRGISTVSDGIQGVVDKGANLAKKGVGKIAEGINSVLDKVTSKGLKSSITKNKKSVVDAGKEVGEAGGEAIANAMGDAAGEAGDKAGKAIKDGIKDAAQRLQDYVRDAFKSALDKMIDATVAAMKKQKDAGLKIFDVQLKTLEKLEKAEESLTKTKEYQQNLRKILDDRDLNRANYIRNRALAIYEGRVDDARMLDLEQQGAETSSIADEASLAESRRKDLAAENLAALREAIAEAKEKAGELFDLQIEAFQKAAADIIKIGPVTIEQYAVMQKELETLANTSSSTMTEQFGEMFEKFTTTVADKMPNQVVGAFSTGLDLLVAEARAKYGLGEDAGENTIIGVTLGMLTSIGDKMGEGGPAVVEAFGAITTDLHSNFTDAKDALLLDVQEAFLVPFKKAFDEADPTAVFQQAIKDGNLAILRDFENTLELNKALMDKMVANLDPAIKKYIELKAAIDAANDAAAGGGGAGGAGFTGNVKNLFNPMGYKTVDSYLTNIALQGQINPILNRNTLLQEANRQRRSETVQSRADIPRTRMKTGGYISAPTEQGVPAILHGGEYVLNARAVNRIGIGALEKMNNNLVPQFKKGGRVPGGSADTMERKTLGVNNASSVQNKSGIVNNVKSAVTKFVNKGVIGRMSDILQQDTNFSALKLISNVVKSVTGAGEFKSVRDSRTRTLSDVFTGVTSNPATGGDLGRVKEKGLPKAFQGEYTSKFYGDRRYDLFTALPGPNENILKQFAQNSNIKKTLGESIYESALKASNNKVVFVDAISNSIAGQILQDQHYKVLDEYSKLLDFKYEIVKVKDIKSFNADKYIQDKGKSYIINLSNKPYDRTDVGGAGGFAQGPDIKSTPNNQNYLSSNIYLKDSKMGALQTLIPEPVKNFVRLFTDPVTKKIQNITTGRENSVGSALGLIPAGMNLATGNISSHTLRHELMHIFAGAPDVTEQSGQRSNLKYPNRLDTIMSYLNFNDAFTKSDLKYLQYRYQSELLPMKEFEGSLNPPMRQILSKLKGYKAGGYVPGSPSMPFPAMLHGGEYVINADAVRNMGIETMRNINQSKFRTPSGTPSYQGRGQATTVSTVNINVDTFIGEEEWFKSMMKSYNVNILPRVQKNAGNETRSFTTYNGLNQ